MRRLEHIARGIRKGAVIVALLCVCVYSQDVSQDISNDEPRDRSAQEVLKEVEQTRLELLYDVAGIKIKKPKDEREGFYGKMSLGLAHTPGLGVSSMMGIEMGYDFIVDSIHSFRIFGFFDRTNHGGFADFEIDKSKPSVMQIYRGGVSAEYRIYASRYVGFALRLASLGSYSLSRTDSALTPNLTTARKKWFYPTITLGPIFAYGRHHELFVGYELLDYEKERGMSVNYLKYSYRF